MPKVRVLVVDDSAFMRKAISMMLESDPEIEVVGTAHNGEDGLEMVARLKPDIVTLDIEMPRMDGLTALRHIMRDYPTPVMMISSLTTEGAQATLEALSLGAVDFIPKQLSYVALDIVKIKDELLAKVKHIARNRVRFARQMRAQEGTKSVMKSFPPATSKPPTGPKKRIGVVAIGASTGGPPALQEIIPALPENLPVPVTIVQHMPPTFTQSLAERLDSMSKLCVKEAEDGEPLRGGVVYIARGGKHMTVRSQSGNWQICLSDEPSSTLHRPAVDVMIQSVAEHFGSTVLGVILTGMGSDGLEGARLVKKKGGVIIAQNEESCVVYGMPRAVVENRLADKVVPLQDMAAEIVSFF